MTEAVIPRSLLVEPWRVQEARWPKHGRHVLAQFDDEKVIGARPGSRRRNHETRQARSRAPRG